MQCSPSSGVADIPEGTVLFGEDGDGRPGEVRQVAAFEIDRHEVTNRQFAAFVAATGYVTEAERQGGSAVFTLPKALRGMDAAQWWRLVEGASWRHPTGPDSNIVGREDYPVVQVTYADAQAYARWAGRALPDEVQWERAARGRQAGPVSPRHWAYDGGGKPRANTWQGIFPIRDEHQDGFAEVAPVGCFPANDFGLQDMIGNVWEWTSGTRGSGIRIIKGGSYLCAMNYCANFRPAGWQAQEHDLAASHIGFRTVAMPKSSNAKQ